MRLILCSFIVLLYYVEFSAQNSSDYSEMLNDAESVLYIQPEQSGKIVEHVIQNSESSSEIIKAYLLEGRSYYVRGDYTNAVKATLEAKKLAEATDNLKMQLKINAFGIQILNLFGLDLAAEKYHSFTKDVVKEHKADTNDLHLLGGQALIEANHNIEQEKFLKALENLSDAKLIFQKIQDRLLVTETEIILAETYLKALPVDLAQIKLKEISNDIKSENHNDFLKMVVLNQLGKVFFLKKEYTKAINTYKEALAISDKLPNKIYKKYIVEGIAINYMALEDSDSFYAYMKAGNILANEVEIDESNAVNTVFNYVNANHTAKRDVVKKQYQRNLLFLSGFIVLILLIWLTLKVRYRSRVKQYEDFIRYFENRQNKSEAKELSKKEILKSVNIPKETENLLIQKLDKFENSILFTRKDMSLASLAAQFDTNTKYLSEVINTHKDKNFNSYINELRINYIIDKLKNNNTYLQYKISYLAEESGFSSHSSFATVFKSVTGIPPTIFIELLKTKKKNIKSSENMYEHVE